MDFLVFSNISLMANMFFLIFSILIHFIWKKEAFVHSLSYTIILLVIPVLSMCLLLSKPILYLNINIPSAFFILAAFVLFINIMNYILFYNVLENEELRFQLTIQKEQIEFQRNKYEQLGAAYKNIRSFMHDTKKHLFYIENYSFLLDIKLLFMTVKIFFQKEVSEGVDDNQKNALKDSEDKK